MMDAIAKLTAQVAALQAVKPRAPSKRLAETPGEKARKVHSAGEGKHGSRCGRAGPQGTNGDITCANCLGLLTEPGLSEATT